MLVKEINLVRLSTFLSSVKTQLPFLVLTKPQRIIFDEVREFVLSQRKAQNKSATDVPPDELKMPNTFPARERQFISNLAIDLHLDVSWDEYDDEDDLDGDETTSHRNTFSLTP